MVGLISVSLFGRVVGDVGLLFHFFGDWCVEGMWGGGRGVVILGIVVTLRVVWWCDCDCDCVLGPHGVVVFVVI